MSRSSTLDILLVAWGKNAVFKNSFSIPEPLSATRILSIPPPLISISINEGDQTLKVSQTKDLTITYNENNQSIYVDFLWDGYESLTGTMTNYTPFEEEVDQSKYVGTYKNQHGATMTLDSEGNGSIVIEGGVTRTFKYVVTSDGIDISDWNDPSYER